MKRIILTLILCMSTLLGFSQLIQDLHSIYDPVFSDTEETDTTSTFSPFGLIKPGVNYSLSFGAGYSAFGRGMGMSNTYISPSISYSPNQKLQVIGGMTLSRNGFNGVSFNDEFASQQQQQSVAKTPMQVWAYAQYNLNNKLSIYAVGSVEQNQSYFSFYSNGVGIYDSQMLGLGLNYKISEKTSIGFRFNFDNSNKPFYGYGRSFGNGLLW